MINLALPGLKSDWLGADIGKTLESKASQRSSNFIDIPLLISVINTDIFLSS